MSFADFSASFREDAHEAVQQKEYNYEATAVKYLLKRMGLSAKKYEIEERSESHTGDKKLTFAWFHAVYPRCPCRLEARRLQDVHKIGLYQANNVKLSGEETSDRFFKTPLFTEYEKILNDYQSEAEVVGMVFPCPEVVHFVLHNGSPKLDIPGSRLCKTSKGGTVFVWEPFQQFIRDHLLDEQKWME